MTERDKKLAILGLQRLSDRVLGNDLINQMLEPSIEVSVSALSRVRFYI